MKVFFIFLGFFFLLWGGAVQISRAQIAVIPFEDISQDINGVDLEVTKLVIQTLKEEGFQVIPLKRVLHFMADNRLRWTGWVEKLIALKLYRELGAELILIGTVTEKDPKRGDFGLTLRLLRATDYHLLWSNTLAISSEKNISLLGLKKYTYKELVQRVIDNLLKELPEELKEFKFYPPEVEIADIFLRPRYVRAGQLMECAVKLSISGPKPQKIFFKLPNGKMLQAIEDEKTKLYLAAWKAPEKEGRYPISLFLVWPEPWQQKKQLFLSTFVVDDTPPKLILKVRGGEKFNGVIAFRRYVTLVPILEKTEPIARWQLVITGKEGQEVLSIEQPGKLPQAFNWRGTDAGGHKLPIGRYHLKLVVWDKAGNRSQANLDLLVVKDPPEVDIQAKKGDENIELDLKLKDHPVPLSSWYIEIWDDKGNLLLEKEGERFFVEKLFLPPQGELFYSLEVRDILGNRYRVRHQKLKPIILRASKEEKKTKSQWLDDF